MIRSFEIFKNEKNWEEASEARSCYMLRKTLESLDDYDISNRDKERIKRQIKNNHYKR